MAVGNTFGATALSSYGGFWLSFAIILTPGGFDIVASIEAADGGAGFLNSFGLFLMVSQISTYRNGNANSAIGMVDLHHYPPDLHAEVDRRILPTFLHPRLGLPSLGYWIP